MEVAISIPEIHPSINTWKAWHYHKYNLEKKRWAEMIYYICLGAKLVEGEVHVTVKYFFKDKRKRDIDNYSPKLIMDGLVGAKIIEDDNSNVVRRISVEMDYDKDNPRTEVIVTPYTKD